MTKMSTAKALVESLAAEGVRAVFGIPGVHTLHIYDALYGHPQIRHVLARNEQSAAYMADGYARATGEPGVCLTVAGPGAANALSGIAQAYTDSSPVLLITSQIPDQLAGKEKGALHELKDQLGLFSSVTAWNKRISSPGEVGPSVSAAMTSMRAERPRPIHLEIPFNVMTHEDDVEIVPSPAPRKRPGDPAKLRQAAELLAQARRPIIWVGGGVISAGAGAELRALAERLQAPVMTSQRGKGAIAEGHYLCLGWQWSRQEYLPDLLDQCDVMLAVGTRFTSMSTDGWKLKVPRQLIHIDLDEREIGRNYPCALPIVADARLALQSLVDQVDVEAPADRRAWAMQIVARQRMAYARLADEAPYEIQVLEEIRAALPEDGILVVDLALICAWALRFFETSAPRTFIHGHGFGPIGFGLPAAIGAKIGCPEKPVVCMVGDGGFMMGCGELATAMEERLPLPILLFNDKAHGTVKRAQGNWFPGRYLGVDLTNPDFLKFAEAFGANFARVSEPEEIGAAVHEALRGDRPTLIEVQAEVQNVFWRG